MPSFAETVRFVSRSPRCLLAASAVAVGLATIAVTLHAAASSALQNGIRDLPVRIDVLGSPDPLRVDLLETALREQSFVESVTRIRPAAALSEASGGSADIARLVAAYPVANPFPEALAVTPRHPADYDDVFTVLAAGEYDDVLGPAMPSIRAQARNAAAVIGTLRFAAQATAVAALAALFLASFLLTLLSDVGSRAVLAAAAIGVACAVVVLVVAAMPGAAAFTAAMPTLVWRFPLAALCVAVWPVLALRRAPA